MNSSGGISKKGIRLNVFSACATLWQRCIIFLRYKTEK